MKKNVAGQVVVAQLVSKTDGSAVTTGTTTCYVLGDGGTQAAGSVGSGACTHEGNGVWSYAPAQAETNYDHVAFTFVNTSAVNATVQIYTSFPQTGDNYARLGAPAGASVSADIAAVKSDSGAIKTKTDSLTFTVAGMVDSNVVDWKGATAPAMTGDAYARLGAPAGVSVSADIAAIQADTNDLQTQIGTAGAGLTSLGDTRLAHLDADVSSRLAGASYTAPDNADISLIRAVTDRLDSTMQDSGSSPTAYQFTTAALVNAPSGSGPTAAEVASAVWDEATASHQTTGTTGKALTSASSAGDPWTSVIEGSYTASDLLRILVAVAAGKTTISGTTVTFRDVTDASTIVTAVMNGSQRQTMALTP